VGKLLYYGDRLVLINSILTSLPIFMLSFFEIPKADRKRMDFLDQVFYGNEKKYRMTRWNIICRPKDQGGVGVEVLEIKK
jgi:hypothetical protein